MIFAGQMPTLSNEACAGKKPLVQIEPTGPTEATATTSESGRSSWPA